MSNSRAETIKEIKRALKERSGKSWSVTGGRGTGYGWITINVPPSQQGEYGGMTEASQIELAGLLGLDRVHFQGVLIPASSGHYSEYLDRANGRPIERFGEQYWD